jgi:TusA-related sulfurtransferase
MIVSPPIKRHGRKSKEAEPLPFRLGRAFVDSIVGADFDRLQTLFAADVRFRALVPAGSPETASAVGARGIVQDWFGETDQRELLFSNVEMVADRLVVAFRLRFRESGVWRMAEQQLVATVRDGRLGDVALVCSGFRPIPDPSGDQPAGPHDRERGNPTGLELRPDGQLDAVGLGCATLTPRIRSAVMVLEPGQLLEIVTDDPTAEEGLASWTRLTGHGLVASAAMGQGVSRFYIRRAARP